MRREVLRFARGGAGASASCGGAGGSAASPVALPAGPLGNRNMCGSCRAARGAIRLARCIASDKGGRSSGTCGVDLAPDAGIKQPANVRFRTRAFSRARNLKRRAGRLS
jgi:hypothetical protein